MPIMHLLGNWGGEGIFMPAKQGEINIESLMKKKGRT